MKSFDTTSLPLAALAMLMAATMPVQAGTVYHADSYQALTSDTRSFRVGDALTVIVVENSSAQSQANSTSARDMSVSATPQDSLHQYTVGADLKHGSGGKGETDRAGSLQAQISVKVQQVAANGDLAVYGIQKITINGETQTIAVSGVVRPIDVASDNTVASTRLANAEIVYNGRGFVDRNQEEGWISRFFGWLGL